MSVNISQLSLPYSVASMSQLEACRVALEHAQRGTADPFTDFDKNTQAWLTESANQFGVENLLKIIEEIAKSAPVFDIEIAMQPDEKLLSTIITWLRSNVATNIFVRLHVRPSILAGLKIKSGRHDYDLSLQTGLLEGTGSIGGIINAG